MKLLIKTYRTKWNPNWKSCFNHSSESEYRMPPIMCRSLSFTCPVNELHPAHLLEALGLLLAVRPAENYVDRTVCSCGSLVQIEVPTNIKASLSASACLWHPLRIQTPPDWIGLMVEHLYIQVPGFYRKSFKWAIASDQQPQQQQQQPLLSLVHWRLLQLHDSYSFYSSWSVTGSI